MTSYLLIFVVMTIKERQILVKVTTNLDRTDRHHLPGRHSYGRSNGG